MRYLFLIYNSENVRATAPASEHEHCLEEHRALLHETGQRGILLGAAPLHPTSTARTLRHHEGKPLVVDGPFAETKEQLLGLYVVECSSLDEAIDTARQIPQSCWRSLEIRPVSYYQPGVAAAEARAAGMPAARRA